MRQARHSRILKQESNPQASCPKRPVGGCGHTDRRGVEHGHADAVDRRRNCQHTDACSGNHGSIWLSEKDIVLRGQRLDIKHGCMYRVTTCCPAAGSNLVDCWGLWGRWDTGHSVLPGEREHIMAFMNPGDMRIIAVRLLDDTELAASQMEKLNTT